MLKYRIVNPNSKFVLDLSDSFKSFDKEETLRLGYIPNEITKSLPTPDDNETVRLIPTKFSLISIQLFSDGNPLYLSDFGFTDNDVRLFTNRLRRSYLGIYFYDLPQKNKRLLQYFVNLYFQRTSFYDFDNKLKSVTEIPLIFNIKSPNLYGNENEGFYIYLKENNNLYQNSLPLFVNFKFNSSLNGISYTYYPKSNLVAQTLQEESEYVEVILNKNLKTYEYSDVDNTLFYLGQNLNINLHELN